ncbi:MAG: hypothetical protein CMN25_18775 [Salinicola sp.]|uniref:hypothetical protein n=1 Tax=Salinicola sp. TaxID=1978524 RepID=UPI000C8F62A7|nr:hypothetical protein [Salinicola sp.]MAM59360.1 hypothetical protein [Salinicola sp.]NRB55581.1 hypothetical protein [Salinicola sp.]
MNRVQRLLIASTLSATLVAAVPASADIAVVVNAGSGIDRLTRSDVVNIFMGRYRKLPTGNVALPVDSSSLKARFYRALVDKDLAEINSYWARLVFSGEASPPQQIVSIGDVHQLVIQNMNALGYVDSSQVPADMHVVLTLSE